MPRSLWRAHGAREQIMPTLLIFGASRGLGRALAEEHLKRGWHVIATVRKPGALDDLDASYGSSLDVEVLDTTDWDAVDELRNRLSGRSLDQVFVNAGIIGPAPAIGEVEASAFSQLLLVNSLAPLRIIDRFADLLAAGGMAAVMSSELGSIAQNDSGGFESYRISKAALDMGMRSIAARRAESGITFLAVAPGWVRTDMGGPAAPLGIEDSIPRLVDMLEQRRGAGGVAYVNYENREIAW